jgi:hypothetical protein
MTATPASGPPGASPGPRLPDMAAISVGPQAIARLDTRIPQAARACPTTPHVDGGSFAVSTAASPATVVRKPSELRDAASPTEESPR